MGQALETKWEHGYIRIILVRVQQGVDFSVHTRGSLHHRFYFPLSFRFLKQEANHLFKKLQTSRSVQHHFDHLDSSPHDVLLGELWGAPTRLSLHLKYVLHVAVHETLPVQASEII